MSVEQINKIYDEMYNSKYNQFINSKNEALGNVDKQEKKADDDAYNYRNQAAQLYSQTTQSTRDYMAKNNLLQSGENVDALSRNTSDYRNNDGRILGNLQNQKNEFTTNRNQINSNFNNDVNAWKGEVESQRAKALYDYQEKLRQEALQRELEAQRIAAANASRSSGGGSSSGGSYTATQQKDDVRNEVMAATRNGNPDEISSTLNFVKQAYDQGIISDSDYNQYTTSLNASYRTNTTAQNKVNNGTYGYSTAPRTTGTSSTSKPKNPKDYFMKW